MLLDKSAELKWYKKEAEYSYSSHLYAHSCKVWDSISQLLVSIHLKFTPCNKRYVTLSSLQIHSSTSINHITFTIIFQKRFIWYKKWQTALLECLKISGHITDHEIANFSNWSVTYLTNEVLTSTNYIHIHSIYISH